MFLFINTFIQSVHQVNGVHLLGGAGQSASRYIARRTCVSPCKEEEGCNETNGAYRCLILMYFVKTPCLVVNCYEN